ncbi:hypothetical protein FHR75_002424 [Kineococcus radiotolerans]|uniref:Uncharacterized protein n=1 Tax=Kineococcus radiotolerans TaxID=131568 RepID=A0A7W4XXU1_KINRA|nr:hypothetical protein [Kineococcus radiotolerans]MBB2901609.1 hypothetical protein [Kineococcus radiotolerans]
MPSSRPLVVLALATGFGALNAALDLSSSPEARFGGSLLNAGWAWAGLAVLAGALVRTPRRAAAAGWLATSAALLAFALADALLRAVAPAATLRGDATWWAASLLVCPVLGFLGSRVRDPGPLGLLARLLVPLGAALEALVLPPGPAGDPVAVAARAATWLLAAAGALAALRHRAREDPARAGR